MSKNKRASAHRFFSRNLTRFVAANSVTPKIIVLFFRQYLHTLKSSNYLKLYINR